MSDSTGNSDKEFNEKIDSIVECLTETNGGHAVGEGGIKDAIVELEHLRYHKREVKKELPTDRPILSATQQNELALEILNLGKGGYRNDSEGFKKLNKANDLIKAYIEGVETVEAKEEKKGKHPYSTCGLEKGGCNCQKPSDCKHSQEN